MNSIISELAKIEYDLFVINTFAVGIQAANGNYYKKNIPVSPLIIQKMIENKGSMGCYQQGYKTDRLRWICFDFDCKNRDNPDMDGLYNNCVIPLINYLDKLNIAYMTEFSGRRGIHVWIIFKEVTSKAIAYHIMSAILSEIKELSDIDESDKWSLDRFPKRESAKKNVVGSQVKFPLSKHQYGGRSFFFEGYFLERKDTESDDFYLEQLEILKKYKPENSNDLCNKLHISFEERITQKFKSYEIMDETPSNLEKIVACLEEVQVYKSIFDRMRKGRAQRYDWLVLLGTFAPFDKNGQLLIRLFQKYPNYDAKTTLNNIKKLKEYYQPACFAYLYSLYNMNMENDLIPEETGVDYICNRLGNEHPIVKEYEYYRVKYTERTEFHNILTKELNYIWENDEVVSASLLYKLNNIKEVELIGYEDVVNGCLPIESDFQEYNRYEDGKERKLISLSSKDRLITTALALRLYKRMPHQWNSYSYNVSLMDNNHIFYPWYSSWGRYISQIRVYLELPFMQDCYIFYIDLKQCYAHIDLLNTYRTIKGRLDDETKKIFAYLSDYNDYVMKKVQNGDRIGVPQGPAYARILSEIHLDTVIKSVCEDMGITDNSMNNNQYHIFRYVDDIVVVCEDEDLTKKMFYMFCLGLIRRGLPINKDKSRYFGKVSNMTKEEKDILLHSDCFNYDLSMGRDIMFLSETEKSERLEHYLMRTPFNIGLLGYIYGSRTFKMAKKHIFYKYGEMIMASREGRGKSFRHFYSYVLSDSDMISQALRNGWFNHIPTDTINYSNFISVLYYRIINRDIADVDVRRISLIYLDEIAIISDMSAEDRRLTQAISEWTEYVTRV